MKKGGSHSYRPSNFYSAVIPGQPAGLNPESISQQSMRPDGFSDVQLHIVARAMRAPE
jgi:hypothetical protein